MKNTFFYLTTGSTLIIVTWILEEAKHKGLFISTADQGGGAKTLASLMGIPALSKVLMRGNLLLPHGNTNFFFSIRFYTGHCTDFVSAVYQNFKEQKKRPYDKP